MSDYDITITRTIHASTARLWSVLTDPAMVSKWMMGATVDSTWEKGAPITWSGEYDGRSYSDKARYWKLTQASGWCTRTSAPCPAPRTSPRTTTVSIGGWLPRETPRS